MTYQNLRDDDQKYQKYKEERRQYYHDNIKNNPDKYRKLVEGQRKAEKLRRKKVSEIEEGEIIDKIDSEK